MSQDIKFPLASSTWDELERAAISATVQSDRYTMGPKVAEFEKEFATYIGSEYAIMVNSGSSANLLIAAAANFHHDDSKHFGADDEVIVPAVSWPTTYYPLTQYGAIMRFVDIDPQTLNYDLQALEAAITPRTKAITCVNLLGNPNDFAAIKKLISGTGIILWEDNCESLGAKFGGKFTGTLGLAGSFSSFFSHHISTMEGGLIATDDRHFYDLLLSLRAHGWTRNLAPDNTLVKLSDDPFVESFRFLLPGYNVRPLEMSGAIGLEQLKKLPGLISGRRKNAELFVELAKNYPVQVQKEIGESSWFGFSMILDPERGVRKEALASHFREKGIEARPIVAGNFTKNAVMKHLPHTISGNLINADLIEDYGLFVGNHHYDMSNMFDILDEALKTFDWK